MIRLIIELGTKDMITIVVKVIVISKLGHLDSERKKKSGVYYLGSRNLAREEILWVLIT